MKKHQETNQEAEEARAESRRYIEAAGDVMIILIAAVLRGMYGD